MPRRVEPAALDAALERAGLAALEPYPGRNSVPWLCRCLVCGHEVTPTYSNLQRGQGGCGYCAGSKIDPTIAVTVMRAAGAEPLGPYPGRNSLPWPSICLTCGRDVRPSYTNVQKGQGACKFCAGRGVEADAAARFMIEHGAQPVTPYPGARAPWLCECSACGRSIEPRYSNVKSGQGACGYCGGVRVHPDEAVALMRSVQATPLVDYPGALTPWLCSCDVCGHKITPTYASITQGQGPCKFCAGNGVDPDEAERRMIDAGVRPRVPYTNSGTPWLSDCLRCGREVTPTYDTVVQGSDGCFFCGHASIDAERARQVMLAAGVRPVAPFPGVSKGWPSECISCGKQVRPSYNRVTDGQPACAYCSGVRIDPADATTVMRAAQLIPLDPYPGVGKPWRSQCERCGHEVTPRYVSVRRTGRGCVFCDPWGFDYLGPGMLYLIASPTNGARKIGIASAKSDRIEKWKLRGWRVEQTWSFEVGADAYRIEQAVLGWWRNDLGLPPYLWREDGYTETVDADRMPAEQVQDFVDGLVATASIAPISRT